MKLYLNQASPYARLVQFVAHEKSLASEIELVWTDPWASEEKLLAVTPFGKVPVLVAHDDVPIVESACICDYLDERGPGPRLMSPGGTERLNALCKLGFGRALIDVAFGAVIQKRYGGSEEGSILRVRWTHAVARAIDALECDRTLSLVPDLGDLAIAVALAYIDFRMPEVRWSARAPQLAAWHARMTARPSMTATTPT